MTRKKQIGIYSGSFDPVHEGHVAFAREALEVCGLDTIVFMPERFPRGKPNVSPISERITELEITLAETPFLVLDAQVDQFTVNETLAELEAQYPGASFTFLVGSDVALRLADWPNIEHITSKYSFAVGMRFGSQIEDVDRAMNAVHAKYVTLSTPHNNMSSRLLRRDT